MHTLGIIIILVKAMILQVFSENIFLNCVKYCIERKTQGSCMADWYASIYVVQNMAYAHSTCACFCLNMSLKSLLLQFKYCTAIMLRWKANTSHSKSDTKKMCLFHGNETIQERESQLSNNK